MFNHQTDYKFESIVNKISLLLVIMLFAISATLAIIDVPPAAQINTLQAWLLGGSYFPVLTALLLFLPFLFLIILVKIFLVLIFNQLFAKDGKKIPYVYKIRWR